MLNRQYSWRFSHGVPAQVAGETIEKIEKRDGVVTKEAFLEESRPTESPTHNCFEWDDTIAAEQWRLWTAGQVIRDLTVKVVDEETPGGGVITTPVFVNVVPRGRRTAQFVSIDSAMKNETHRQTVLQNALAELTAFERKYGRLDELSGVFREIGKLNENRRSK